MNNILGPALFVMIAVIILLAIYWIGECDEKAIRRRQKEYEDRSIKAMKDFERALTCANLTGRPQPIGRDECRSSSVAELT